MRLRCDVMAADKEVARLALLLSTRHVARHDYAADLRVPGFLLESQQREAQVLTSSSVLCAVSPPCAPAS